MTILLIFSNCRIITHQITSFKNIQYDKLYFPCRLVCVKTSNNEFASFFGRYSHFKFRFFSEVPIFMTFQNCRIVTAKTTNFETIKHDKIYIPCSSVYGKTSYNKFALFFWKIFPYKFRFFQKCQVFSNFQGAA